MRIRILGSGTSTGVPEIGCTCNVCTSQNIKDKRFRTSVIVDTGDATILLDCGPDFREQMLRIPFRKIDGVLISHVHYDHAGGLDDLRPFCKFGEIPVYAEHNTARSLRIRMPYCFARRKYPGAPDIELKEISVNSSFKINNSEILPVRVMHANLPILGYRIGNMAYITDMLTMPDESFELLKNLDLLVLNALRIKPHASHQNLSEALETAKKIHAKQTYFIHMSHSMGLHTVLDNSLPEHINLAYDGLELEI